MWYNRLPFSKFNSERIRRKRNEIFQISPTNRSLSVGRTCVHVFLSGIEFISILENLVRRWRNAGQLFTLLLGDSECGDGNGLCLSPAGRDEGNPPNNQLSERGNWPELGFTFETRSCRWRRHLINDVRGGTTIDAGSFSPTFQQ